MKIHTQTPPAVLPGTAAKPEQPAGSTSARQAQPAPQDMHLSPLVHAFSSTGAGHDAGFDAQRVQAMRQAIADGSFRVNAQVVADKLLENAKEFLSRS